MPELPEVERVRLSLLERLPGKRVVAVQVRRHEVIRRSGPLLLGQTIARIERHGKQLAILATGGASTSDPSDCLCVHLGMTGSLRCVNGTSIQMSELKHNEDPHLHIAWRLDDGCGLLFRDPRRFGGLWSYPGFEALHQARWRQLGHDALTIRPMDLHRRLSHTHRPLKAALLDQAVLAGLGNIYVDELLFACRLHPLTPAGSLAPARVRHLVRKMRPLLQRAIDAGGSTLRDYVDGNGQQGGFQSLHKVYGRAGQNCPVCQNTLCSSVVAGRTSVWCRQCQPVPSGRDTKI
jgi:formamidopyrimidine-DNA glycosylase